MRSMGFMRLCARRGLGWGCVREISSEAALLRESRAPEVAPAMEAKAAQETPVPAPRVEQKPAQREDWFRVLPKELFDGVTVVRDGESAATALKVLASLKNRPHAWDTETTGVDPKKESPIGKGRVICATAFAGDDVDFGSGPRLFIDNLDAAKGTLDYFSNYFANERLVKVWHNYSFDKHVLNNEGINIRGFGGDTMHMARLANTARRSYSLKALCETYLDETRDYGKQDLVTRFGYKRILKDGSEGKDTVVPETVELQRSVEHAAEWVDYATRDAELTYQLYWSLRRTLEDIKIAEPSERNDLGIQNMSELYSTFFLAYGELLADIEQLGVRVDVSRLKTAQALAEADREHLEAKFRDWVCTFSPDAKHMNVNSDKQKQQILFAPFKNTKTDIDHPKAVKFKMEEALMVKEQVIDKESGKLVEREVLKKEALLVGRGLECPNRTVGGLPSVAASSLKLLAGKPRADPPVYGLAKDPEACLAIDSIIEASAVSTLLSSFIVPLQDYPDANGRIHASLNLNTETGRLSSRRPNLQNQPALEKDRYKVRDAFVAAPGNSLIVADYGQLELRLLAHITGCKSMLDAFRLGGDFHSRTAATMYSEVQQALREGACVLEGDGSGDVPLVKDMFPTERRRAKTLNFSIAYGKTVMGLAKDWGISREEAKETLALWYREREEVRFWQKRCLKKAREKEFVETIIGRRRNLPDIRSSDPRRRYHAERAAINAPLQGSAADVVMAAMLSLDKDDCLRALGWRIVLQVHDEILLEGPKWSEEVAKARIRKVMERPEGIYLTVALEVSPKSASSWYKAK